MKFYLKILLLALYLCYPIDILAQIRTMYFSTTGDTVCYSDIFGVQIDSLHTSHTIHIQRKKSDFEVEEISSFQMISRLIESYNKDTLKKYNLKPDGVDANLGTNKDFMISVKPTNIRLIDTSSFGLKFIYQTKVIVNISCKGQKLYSKQFDIMFKGNSPKDFPQEDIVRITSWRKKNTNKYFIDLNVKEYQTFEKPKETPDYKFANFLFVL